MPLYNTKQFIKVIQSRPCLWNVNLKEYNDRNIRQAAWEEVATILYMDWADLDDKEKTEKKRDLQKKWKGLRDYFTRVKNKNPRLNKTESGKQKKRRTPFLDMLSFLNETKQKRSLQASQNNEPHREHVEEMPKTKEKCPPIVEITSPVIRTGEPKADDSDWNFLLSILPDMKSMDPTQNFEFRYQIMTLIKNMKYSQPSTEFYYANAGPSFSYQLPSEESKIDIDVHSLSNESIVFQEEVKFSRCSSPSSSHSKSSSP